MSGHRENAIDPPPPTPTPTHYVQYVHPSSCCPASCGASWPCRRQRPDPRSLDVPDPTYTMAGLLSLGGAMGYAKRRSNPSLVGGVGLGAVFAVAGYTIQQGSSPSGTVAGLRQGHDMALGASVATAAVMAQRRRASPCLPCRRRRSAR